VNDGETARVQVQLTRLPAAPSPVVAVAAPRRAVPVYRRAWFIGTLAGVVGAGLVTGLAVGLTQTSKTYPFPIMLKF
jgi:hypothetical protein